jgi:hypothetical protein
MKWWLLGFSGTTDSRPLVAIILRVVFWLAQRLWQGTKRLFTAVALPARTNGSMLKATAGNNDSRTGTQQEAAVSPNEGSFRGAWTQPGAPFENKRILRMTHRPLA